MFFLLFLLTRSILERAGVFARCALMAATRQHAHVCMPRGLNTHDYTRPREKEVKKKKKRKTGKKHGEKQRGGTKKRDASQRRREEESEETRGAVLKIRNANSIMTHSFPRPGKRGSRKNVLGRQLTQIG